MFGRFLRSARAWPFCALLVLGSGAQAAPLMLTDMLGDLEATVTFEVSGTDLVVTLTNSSPNDALVPVDILTALFWDTDGSPLGLSPEGAMLGATSVVHFGPDNGGDVGGEWAYEEDINAHGRNTGISSAGFDIFGSSNRFGPTNLQGPDAVDGMQYGITSDGDDTSTGNAAVTGGNALIQDTVVFTLGGIDPGFDPSTQISRVAFQYGTSLDEPWIPEPATFALISIVGAGIMLPSRRTAKRA